MGALDVLVSAKLGFAKRRACGARFLVNRHALLIIIHEGCPCLILGGFDHGDSWGPPEKMAKYWILCKSGYLGASGSISWNFLEARAQLICFRGY